MDTTPLRAASQSRGAAAVQAVGYHRLVRHHTEGQNNTCQLVAARLEHAVRAVWTILSRPIIRKQ